MGQYNFTTGITASAEYTANKTLSLGTRFALVDAMLNDITISLPASSSSTRAKITIKKIDSSSHKVTVDASETETIDGEETIDLTLQYQYITVICDGSEWFIIGGEYVKMEDTLNNLLDEQKDTNDNLDRLLLGVKKLERHLQDMTELELDSSEIQEEVNEEKEDYIGD